MYKLFKLLGSKSRLRILKILLIRKCCVCEISGILKLSNATISEHLKKLKQFNLIKEQKESYWTYYYINPAIEKDENLNKLLQIINSADGELYENDAVKIREHAFKCD